MAIHCYDETIAKLVAQSLLSIKAIKLNPEKPYTWASGWRSPIYCDNRQSLSYPKVRTEIKKYLSEAIKSLFPEVEGIAGVATAGIPQGALVAEYLDLPFIYVRSKSKGHGLTNQIEGFVEAGSKIVVLEDLVSTGGSSLAAVSALRTADVTVLGMASIFTYGFPVAEENFKNANVDLVYLSDYDILLNVALEKNYINADVIEALSTWRKDPSNWKY